MLAIPTSAISKEMRAQRSLTSFLQTRGVPIAEGIRRIHSDQGVQGSSAGPHNDISHSELWQLIY